MNDFDYDYMNYVTNIPNGMNSNYNKKGSKDMGSDIVDANVGFVRGNIFGSLYDSYKSYKPVELNPMNERDALLNQWQTYNFQVIELNLYLDVYPNDVNAIKMFNNYNNILKQITKKYEDKYGPICLDDANSNTSFNWVNNWPWEVSE